MYYGCNLYILNNKLKNIIMLLFGKYNYNFKNFLKFKFFLKYFIIDKLFFI